jgi:outer membrane biosynthesis protein TonB
MYAADDDEAECVTLLLNAGANPAIRDSDGQTAMALAMDEKNVAAIRALQAGPTRGAPTPPPAVVVPPEPSPKSQPVPKVEAKPVPKVEPKPAPKADPAPQIPPKPTTKPTSKPVNPLG